MRLFLDDERDPPRDGNEWHVVRSVPDAVAWVEANGFPGYVAFDNDLGDGQAEGWRFAQWLIERDLDRGGLPDGFGFHVHSQNPVRRADIEGRLSRYLAHRSRPGSCLGT